jgi:hypothetical protein
MSLGFGIGLIPFGGCGIGGDRLSWFQRIGNDLSTDPHPRPMANSYDLPAAIVSDTLETLMGHLATADAAANAAANECKRLRDEIAGIMIAADVTSERTCWGLVSLTSRDKVTYSPAIKVLEINLKAEKDKEVATGAAKVTEGDKFIRVTWAK